MNIFLWCLIITSFVVYNVRSHTIPKTCNSGEYSAYPGSCTKFFMCDRGLEVEKECGPGTNWNDNKKICDWPANAGCTETTTTETDNNEISENEMDPTSCTESGELSANPSNCNMYYICDHNRKTAMNCGLGLHWNDEQKVCDWPRNAGCTEGPTIHTQKETSESTNEPLNVLADDHE